MKTCKFRLAAVRPTLHGRCLVAYFLDFPSYSGGTGLITALGRTGSG